MDSSICALRVTCSCALVYIFFTLFARSWLTYVERFTSGSLTNATRLLIIQRKLFSPC
ncbi:hypothetical protein BDN67DRAFT_60808 [Paxillus ammoniavirescens]|nr:hypothetical protein BDN67DRAFT_60808 [Paxillus ammoniavirescens]